MRKIICLLFIVFFTSSCLISKEGKGKKCELRQCRLQLGWTWVHYGMFDITSGCGNDYPWAKHPLNQGCIVRPQKIALIRTALNVPTNAANTEEQPGKPNKVYR
jgi:hypothetical protein